MKKCIECMHATENYIRILKSFVGKNIKRKNKYSNRKDAV